jgi:tetratricopeptide (TPR) repeat protein
MNYDELIKSGNYQEALPLVEVELSRNPDDNLRRSLVHCLVGVQRYEDALVPLSAIADVTTSDLSMLAWIYQNLSRWDEMASVLKHLAKNTPNARIYYGLAVAEIGDQAIYELDAASKQIVKEYLLRAKKYDDCYSGVFDLLLRVLRMQNAGNDEVLATLEEAHSRFPTEPDFRFQLTWFLVQKRLDAERILELIAPLLDNPEYANGAHWCAFEALVTQSRFEEAILHLDRIELEADEDANRQRIKADLLLRQNKLGEWLIAYESLNPSESDEATRNQLRRAYVNLELGDTKSGISRFVHAATSLLNEQALPLSSEVYLQWSTDAYATTYAEFDVLYAICEELRGIAGSGGSLSAETKGLLAYILHANYEDVDRGYWADLFSETSETLLATAARLLDYPTSLKRDLALEAIGEDLPSAVGLLLDHSTWQRYVDGYDLNLFRRALFGGSDKLSESNAKQAKQISQSLLVRLRECHDDGLVTDVFLPFYDELWRAVLFELAEFDVVLEISQRVMDATDGENGSFDYAYSLAELGRHEEAGAAYKDLIGKEPNNAAAINNLAVIYEQRGLLDEAMKLFSRAAEINPKSELYRNNCGRTQERLHKWEQAQQRIASALGAIREHARSGGFSNDQIDAFTQDYWNTTKSNSDIEFDHRIRPTGAYRLATLVLPKPTETLCPNCSSEMFFRSRSDQSTKIAECLGCGHQSSGRCSCEYCSRRRQEENRIREERQRQLRLQAEAAERKKAIEELERLEAKYCTVGHVDWALERLDRKEQSFLKALAENLQIDGQPDFTVICEKAGVVSEKAYLKKLKDLKLVFQDFDGHWLLNRAVDVASIKIDTVRRIPPTLRFEVLQRDNHTCQYCGRTPPEVKLVIDHLIPVAKGGTDDFDNLITSCDDCNSGKSDKLIQTFTGGLTKEERAKQIQVRRSSILQARRERLDEIRDCWKNALNKRRLSVSDEEAIMRFIERYEPDWIIAAISIAGKKKGLSEHAKYAGGILRKWAKDGPPEQLHDPDAGLEKLPATAKQITYIASLLKQADLELKDVSDKSSLDELTMLDAKIIIGSLTAPLEGESKER